MNRQILSAAIAELMPEIIRGVHLDFFTRHTITQTQFLVLVALLSRRSCSMSDLARQMAVRLPTATGIVERLVQGGFVRRETRAEDRRTVWISLSPKGERLILDFKAAVRERWKEVLKGLPEAEQENFYRIVTHLRRYLAGAEK